MQSIFPNKDWKFPEFSRRQRERWKDITKHRKFFDSLAVKLNLKTYEDWYQMSKNDINKGGGHGLMKHYGNSFTKALRNVYPQHMWQVWRFKMVSKGFWDDKENVFEFMEYCRKELKVSMMEQWYNIGIESMYKLGGLSLLRKYGGLIPLLREVYPDFAWHLSKFVSIGKLKRQRLLAEALKDLFPQLLIVTQL